MTQEKLKETYNLFTDVWKMYKRFSDARDDDEYFSQLSTAASEIDKKYNSRLARDLLISVMDDLNFLALHPGTTRPVEKAPGWR